jgi:hypothetical protein
VRNGSTFTVYINGVASGTSTTSSALDNRAIPYVIGATSNGGFRLTGYISGHRYVVGTAVYTSNFTPPTAPPSAVANTQLLTNFTNAAIFDNAMMNDLETVGNAQISTSVVKFGTGSMSFPASTDFMRTFAISTGVGTWTVEGWFYFNSLNNERALLSQGTADTTACWLFWTDANGTIRFYSNGNIAISSSGAVSAGAWQHIALVSNASAVTIYVNGTSVATGSYSGKVFNALPLQINQGYGGATSGNVGYMDDLRITLGVARYTATFTPPTAALPNK